MATTVIGGLITPTMLTVHRADGLHAVRRFGMLKRKRGALPVTEGDGKFPGIGLVVAPEASADGA